MKNYWSFIVLLFHSQHKKVVANCGRASRDSSAYFIQCVIFPVLVIRIEISGMEDIEQRGEKSERLFLILKASRAPCSSLTDLDFQNSEGFLPQGWAEK